jgi:signal transduction histidine kinase
LQATLSDLSASHRQLEKTQLELIQAAKLESVGTLAAGVAHEVKNPLQIILMGLDYLDQRVPQGGPRGEETRITLGDMRDAALRANRITRELLQFSTANEFTPEPADLESVLDRSLWLLRTDITKSGVQVVKDLSGGLPLVAIDIPKVQQVLINLVGNALQAMDRGGTLAIATFSDRLDREFPDLSTGRCPFPPDTPAVILRIRDSGPGIPEQQLLRIFDPFFTTKAVGSGTGLGLSVVKRIVDLHGGFIHFRNSPHGGLEVTLAFAAVPQATPATPAGSASPVLVAT